MTDAIQLVVAGISHGMIYALVAFGYNITYSTCRKINFALGDLLMAGTVIGFALYIDKSTGIPYGRNFIVPLVAVMLTGAILGIIVHETAIEPSRKVRSEYGWILSTLAVGIIIQNAVEQFWSTEDYRFASPLGDTPLRIAGVGIYPQEILILIACPALVIFLEWLRRRTTLGKAIQAVSEDTEAANVIGINSRLIVRLSFALGAAVAGFAGVLIAPMTLVSATMGTVLGVKAYAVAVLGGLETGLGIIPGGLILGLSESLTARYLSSGYKDIPGLVLLIVVVFFRPSGLFGIPNVKKL